MARAIRKGKVRAGYEIVELVEGKGYFPANADIREYLPESAQTAARPWNGQAR